MSTEFILSTVIVVLVIVLLFMIYNRRRFYEGFAKANPTSFELYNQNNSKNFDSMMSQYMDVLGDINNLLLVYGCGINLGMAPGSFDTLVKTSADGLYMVPFNILTNNYYDVNAKVYSTIVDFYEKKGRMLIQGQVYVILSQAPFYRDEQNKPIAVQFNADDYLYKSTNLMKSTNVENNPILQYHGYVIFNAYDSSGTLITDIDARRTAVMNIKKNFRQKEKLCFISCLNNDLPCGCASQDLSESQGTSYTSHCLESERTDRMSPGEKYTYAILFRVNPRFSDFIGRQILDMDYSDYQWSPDSLNRIPTRARPTIPPPTFLNINTQCPDNLQSASKGVTFYQHCDYKGWESLRIPPGKYNMDALRCYGVNTDVSAYKQVGGMKVKLYAGPEYTQPANNGNYITGNTNCFTKYKDLNDNLQGVEIAE